MLFAGMDKSKRKNIRAFHQRLEDFILISKLHFVIPALGGPIIFNPIPTHGTKRGEDASAKAS